MANDVRMSAKEINDFLDRDFPQVHHGGRSYVVEAVSPMRARVRMIYHDRHLRPGGTISGPSMMGLCDLGMYAALLGQIGPVALAVTTNLNINFLRKPDQNDLIAEAEIIKLGKRLAVGEVRLRSDGSEDLVAQATLTYSVPPREKLG